MALKPHPQQQMILDDPSRFRVAAVGRRWGKMELCKFAAEQQYKQSYGGQILYISANYHMIRDAGEAFAPLLRSGLFFYTTTPERASADEAGSVDLLLIDEPGLMESFFWPEMERLVRPGMGRLLAVGTPRIHDLRRPVDLLYWMFGLADSSQEWAKWEFPSAGNPTIYPDELERIKATYSDVQWRSQFMAEFITKANQDG